MGARRAWRRRRAARATVAGLVAGSLLASCGGAAVAPREMYDLAATAIAVAADGSVSAVPLADFDVRHRTRRCDRDAVAAQAGWLARGTAPGAGTRWAELGRTALLDLRVLTSADGAVRAGWASPWRYTWPRDASAVAVAFARTGHTDDAAAVLGFLQRVQRDDGLFEARYDDGGRVPDGRGVQLDGSGWALWALHEVASAVPPAERPALLDRFAPLAARATAALRRSLGPDGLPHPSSDYWERRETRLTLGTAAVVLLGLEAAAELHAAAELPDAAHVAADAARVRAAVSAAFSPGGFPRYAGGDAHDAAVTFLAPPFVDQPLSGVVEWLAPAAASMARPAGGVAPGEGWKADGMSWTPQTALFALAAAGTGDVATAERWLDWLAAHRTPSGALPEKVLPDGSPGSVAPLAWTAALVVLTLDELGATAPAAPGTAAAAWDFCDDRDGISRGSASRAPR